jgi:hypothetical protein
MNLYVTDQRGKSRRNTNQPTDKQIEKDRRKGLERRVTKAQAIRTNNVKRIWLTRKSKALMEDLLFLE